MQQRAAGSRAVPTQLCQSRREGTLTSCGHLWTCSTRRERKGSEALVTSGKWPFQALPHQLSSVLWPQANDPSRPSRISWAWTLPMAQDPRLRASCSSLMTRPHQTLNSVLILGCSFTGHLSSVWPREVLWRGGRGPLKKGFDRRRGGEFCSPSSGPQSPDQNVQSIVAY